MAVKVQQRGGDILMGKLTAKQQRFVEEYLIDLNATRAAIRSGYSNASAYSIGIENLNKPVIKSHIDAAIAERSRRTGINAERVLRELARIAFVNASDVINMDSVTIKETASEDDTAAIASVKVKTFSSDTSGSVEREIKFADKLKALELLGKHLGMFSDNVKLTGDVGVVIVNDIPKPIETG